MHKFDWFFQNWVFIVILKHSVRYLFTHLYQLQKIFFYQPNLTTNTYTCTIISNLIFIYINALTADSTKATDIMQSKKPEATVCVQRKPSYHSTVNRYMSAISAISICLLQKYTLHADSKKVSETLLYTILWCCGDSLYNRHAVYTFEANNTPETWKLYNTVTNSYFIVITLCYDVCGSEQEQ